MSTIFAVMVDDKEVEIAKRTGKAGGFIDRPGVDIEWLNPLSAWLVEDEPVFPTDNTAQGVFTVGDLRELDREETTATQIDSLNFQISVLEAGLDEADKRSDELVRELVLVKEHRDHFRNVMTESFDECSDLRKEVCALKREITILGETVIKAGPFTITLFKENRNDGRSGFFEHNEFGEDNCGGLWIRPSGEDGSLELYDYDGCYTIPEPVAEALEDQGIYLH